MPSFKSYLFGFDDTFADLRSGYEALYSSVFGQFDIPFDAGSVLEYADTPLDTLFSQKYRGCTCRFRDFVTMTMASYEKHMLEAAKLHDDADVLNTLMDNGFKLGTFSISFEEHMRGILSKLGVENMFSAVVGAERTFVPRPNPFVIETCLRDMGACKESAVVVTTSETDVLTAVNAGVRCAMLDRTETLHETGYGYVIGSLRDLLSISVND